MPTYTYKCTDEGCNFVTERVQSIHDKLPEHIKCQKCNKSSQLAILTAPALGLSSMDSAPIDAVIGRDAEARWEDIKRRQKIRNSVRKKAGQEAISMTGRNEFTPIEGGERRFVAAPNSGIDKD